MNCKETQDNIPLFLLEKLDLGELQLFLEHIENCSKCMEELEVYYTLYKGMKILEDDTEYDHNNYEIDVGKELERAKEQLRREKRVRIQKNLFFILIMIIMGIFVL